MKKRLLLFLIICFGILQTISVNQIYAQCPTGSLTFTTQEEIDDFSTNYPGCTELTTTLTIEGNDITNLSGLAALRKIDDPLVVIDTEVSDLSGLDNVTYIEEFYLFTNHSLTSLTGLEAVESMKLLWISGNSVLQSFDKLTSLTSVTRKLSVTGNSALVNLAGLEQLSFADDLNISSNDNLLTLQGLHNIVDVLGRMTINANNKLIDLSGLEKLERVEEIFLIKGNAKLTSVQGLNALDYCRDLVIDANLILPNLSGLSNLNSIDKFEVIDNSQLINLSGLANNLNLKEVLIQNNSLTSFTGFQGVSTIETFNVVNNFELINFIGLENLTTVNDFFIDNNPKLVNLTGLEGLDKVVDHFEIINNSSLVSLSGLDNMTQVGNGLDTYEPLFRIYKNDVLESLDGLGKLSFVDGAFEVLTNNTLEDFIGADIFSFARTLIISGNQNLTSLAGLSNFSNAEDFLSIAYNPKLTSLEGISNFNSIPEEGVSISSNALLTTCDIEGFCNLIEMEPDKISFSNNATGCANETEVVASCSPLAIAFSDFQGIKNKDTEVILSWHMNNDIQQGNFVIWRSNNNQKWTTVAMLNEAIQSNVNTCYFTDTQPFLGDNYYYVEYIDVTGASSTSATINITVQSTEEAYTVYPMPFTEVFSIYNDDKSALKSVSIYNNLGQLVYEQFFEQSDQKSLHQINCHHLASGHYLIRINNGLWSGKITRF
ncbi:MAG: T9SS type A sorting domain-containing protein [Saprospiraceae bacterium]